MGLRFLGWGISVPDRIVTNDELSTTLDTSDEWISERTGIRQRHVGGSAGSLALIAARRAIADAGIDVESIEFIILATTTSDDLIPATAPTIARELGITAPAVDVNAACSGFMYAVRMAEGLLATGTERALVIGAENLTRWLDWNDRATAVLFGDGAGAAIVERTDDDGDLLGFDLGSDGTLARFLGCPHGGTIFQDGKEVFRRAVRIMVESSQSAMAQAKVTADELALVIPHQANIRIIQAACSRLGVDESRAMVVLDHYGNTSSASIPLAVEEAKRTGRLHRGDLVLLTGFGAGMTWASAVLRWNA